MCLNAQIVSYSECIVTQNNPCDVHTERILKKIKVRDKTSPDINTSGFIGGKSFTLIHWILYFIVCGTLHYPLLSF